MPKKKTAANDETSPATRAPERPGAASAQPVRVRATCPFVTFHGPEFVAVTRGQVIAVPAEIAAQLVAAGHGAYAE